MTTLTRRGVLAGLAVFATFPASAQQSTLKVVFPFAAGGAADAIVRQIAEQLQKSLERSVVVENKSGAGGQIGAQFVKEAPPDGSTLLFAAAAQFTLQPHVTSKLGYDPFKDFVPLARVMKFEQGLAVSSHVPARSIPELVAWLKANPDQAAFGSPGPCTGPHLAGLELGRTFGIALRHVPYRGTPAAMPDLLTGRLPIFIASIAELMEQHRGGGIRVLATAGAERYVSLPDVPTLKESGVNIVAPGWFAFYAPAGTPKPALDRLAQAIVAAALMPAIRDRMQALGFEPTDLSANDLEQVQRREFDAWALAAKTIGYKAE
jgi:tripartite-type tricarboxylate transporter receptor subunit TctC